MTALHASPPALAQLAVTWRARAADLREWAGADGAARALEHAAAELDAALAHQADELLSLEQAASESQYSVDHLRHLVANGSIPNAGRKHAPRIRRRDLPKRPGHAARSDYDPSADALRIARGA